LRAAKKDQRPVTDGTVVAYFVMAVVRNRIKEMEIDCLFPHPANAIEGHTNIDLRKKTLMVTLVVLSSRLFCGSGIGTATKNY
jgi:hypothetical protein